MPDLNRLLLGTDAPPIPEAARWARRYDGAFGPLIDLSQAVPGTPPHPDLLARLGRAAADPAFASYGPISGETALREAYAAHVSRLYGADVHPEEVAITAGCNLAFVAAAIAVARAGDAFLLPSPWYFNHKMTLDMLGIEARPLPCRAEAGFVPDPIDAARLIDGRVRAIVLVSPNNPTGAVYSNAVLAGFLDLCRARGLFLVTDETYRDFSQPGQPHALLADPGWRETLIQLYSFSKAYAVPGHRTGAILAGQQVIAEMSKALDCLQICAPRAVQAALAHAIPALEGWRRENRDEIAARAHAFRSALGGLGNWRIDSIGAYFAYLRHPAADMNDRDVAEILASRHGILCLPGSWFGPGEGRHLRVAFANVGRDVIATLPQRLRQFEKER